MPDPGTKVIRVAQERAEKCLVGAGAMHIDPGGQIDRAASWPEPQRLDLRGAAGQLALHLDRIAGGDIDELQAVLVLPAEEPLEGPNHRYARGVGNAVNL